MMVLTWQVAHVDAVGQDTTAGPHLALFGTLCGFKCARFGAFWRGTVEERAWVGRSQSLLE